MNVFRRLQIKMVANILVVHAIILAVLLGMLNLYIYRSNSKKAAWYLNYLLQSNRFEQLNELPEPVPPSFSGAALKPPLSWNIPQNIGPMTRLFEQSREKSMLLKYMLPVNSELLDMRNYFMLLISSDGKIKKIINELHIRLSDAGISAIGDSVYTLCRSGTYTGLYQGISWKAKKYEDGYLASFLDRGSELEMEKELLSVSIAIYGISVLCAFVFAWLLSVWTVHPVKEDFEKQKQFIADAGHELKTPIAVIGANIDVLQGTYPDNKWLEYIKEENLRMGELVKNLLYLAKADASRVPMVMTQFDLVEAVNSVVLPFESTFYEQGKRFRLEVPDTPVMMHGDEQKIKQVIIILVDNALKNSDSGAVVRVSAFASGNRRIVKVYNTGHGIAQKDLKKIFERFYRADTSRTRQTGGCGLGLAIARSIAEAHSGTLTAESSLDKWAEFILNLPSGGQGHRFYH